MLASERIEWFFCEGHRLEYTEYGGGDHWVVLVPGQLMTRTMHRPLARHLAAAGAHVISLDPLGHGRSDRPADPMLYSITAFAEQVIALLEHLGAHQAVVGGTSLGANVALEVADLAPARVRGLLLEMPVLDNAVEAGVVAFAPLLLAARTVPLAVGGVRLAGRILDRAVPSRLMPFWGRVGLEALDQSPDAMAAMLHGLFFGRFAPPTGRRTRMEMPAMVIGHPSDPVHPAADAAMLAEEMPGAEFVAARSIAEWRLRPKRLDAMAAAFVNRCWEPQQPRRARRDTTSSR